LCQKLSKYSTQILILEKKIVKLKCVIKSFWKGSTETTLVAKSSSIELTIKVFGDYRRLNLCKKEQIEGIA